MSILHVITGLNVGGAEAMLAKLLEQGTACGPLRPEVLSLLPPGPLGDRIRRLGIPIRSARMPQGRPRVRDAAAVIRTARSVNPSLVHGWMHHGNLAASLAAAAAPSRPPVIWNIRHSLSDIAHEKPMSRLVLRAGRMLSRTPSAIIFNSAVAARQYAAFGYSADRAIVIPNGFDCTQFRPPAGSKSALRQRLDIEDGSIVVAMVARVHPMKDHANLVEAVRRARADGHDLHLLLAGTGTASLPEDLMQAIRLAVPHDRLTLLGERHDVDAWLGSVDIVALSSAWGEAFPNVLGEAMACGVPCVATDVGDSADIVGDLGRVVPPRDPQALAAALGWLAGLGAEGRARLGTAARERVVERYALDRIARRYGALYESVLAGHRSNAASYGGARPAEAA